MNNNNINNNSENKFTLQTSIKFLQDNLSLILIVPGVLGGLWQLMELSKISSSYIRFFSVTQIIPDGLLILIILVFIVVIWTVFTRITNYKVNAKQNSKNDINVNENRNSRVVEPLKKSDKRVIAVVSLILICFVVYLIELLIQFHQDKSLSIFDIVLYFCMLSFFVLIVFKLVYFILIFSWESLDKIGLHIWLFLFLCLSTFVVHIGYQSLIILHKSFILPSTLKNIENIQCKVLDPIKKDTFEILYFNDTHIFMQIKNLENIDDTIQHIKILKFEDLYDNESCIKYYEAVHKEKDRVRKNDSIINANRIINTVKLDSIKNSAK